MVWFFTRPHVDGVKCLLTDSGRVLLVRHTYGAPVWDLPGGRIDPGEAPIDAARREVREELGLTIDDWRALGSFAERLNHRHDTVHAFATEVRSPPLEVEFAELARVEWFAIDSLPTPIAAHASVVLSRSERSGRATT